MKKIFLIMLVFAGLATKAQVGIGVAATDVDASAQLEVKSTNKGLLIPRMTASQKAAISSPANGLLVYQTDGTSGFYYYNGSSWNSIVVDVSGYATTLSLNAETARAQSAEATLTSSLATKATTTALNTEVSRAQSAEAGLTSSLNAETARAQSAEATLTSSLATKATTNDLNTEVLRAQAAEATLTSSLATKANLASPSFTGVVTVGGASSTASAAVEVSSTTKGFLPPRMTGAQRDAISSPAAGLVLWCTNCGDNGELNVYNGTSWKNMVGGTTSTAIIPPIVTIGSQVWMNINLNVDRYRNGDPIPKVEDGATWQSSTTGAYCYYNNDSATYAAKYGKLYNWYAVNDSRGLAPVGYHVPTKTEWETLINTNGGILDAGASLKEVGTTYWDQGNVGATNSTGFSARGGGYRHPDNGCSFYYEKTFSYFWVSTPNGGNTAYFYGPHAGGNSIYGNPYPYGSGFSVRLIKD